MKTDSPGTSYHDFRRSLAGCQLTVQLGLDHGLTLEQCLHGSGITADMLQDPAADISLDQEIVLTRNVVTPLRQVPALGVEAGLRYSLSTFGIWGFALLASSTIRAALDVATRYHALAMSFNPVTLQALNGNLRLLYADADTPEDLRTFSTERSLACTVRITRELAGKAMPMNDLRLRASRPAHAARLEEVFGVMPQFDAHDNSFAIDGPWLDTPIVFGNPIVARQVEDQCRALVESRRQRDGMALRVRDAILHNPTRIPSMDAIAGELCMTVRTLRRKLEAERTSYRELVEEVRQTLAQALLKQAGMKMEEVAERLGYSDATSFAHAFRRWKGRAPSEFR
ncbi:MAG: AraC family transcriptional regulator [Gammaproteobacteria bacterium]